MGMPFPLPCYVPGSWCWALSMPELPDDDGDSFAWAEGCGPLTRNGHPLPPRTWPGALQPDGVVFVSQAADRHPYGNLKCVQPARFRDVPSIAYRLALAATEGVAAVSLNGPRDYDYGAGHAILKGAGGILVNERGQEVTYNLDGSSHVGHCFGGDPNVAVELAKQPWDQVPGSGFGIAAPPVDLASVAPVRLEPGKAGSCHRRPTQGARVYARPTCGRQPRRACRVPISRLYRALLPRRRADGACRRRPSQYHGGAGN